MKLLLILLNIGLLAWLAWRTFSFQTPDTRKHFWPALSFKITAGLAVGILYWYHYQAGDTLAFWNDGVAIANLIHTAPGQAFAFFWNESNTPDFTTSLVQLAPRSLFFSKICGVAAFITSGNYWLMASWLSMFSFLASWQIFRRVSEWMIPGTSAAALAFLYFPSVVFWSSGLIKESLGLAAIYLLASTVLLIMQGSRPGWLEWILVLLAIWVGWNLKYYWMGIFIPVILAVVATTMLVHYKPSLARWDVAIWAVLLVLFLVAGTNVHPNFSASRFLEVITANNLEFTRLSDPPRIVQYLNLEPAWSSILLNAPAALIAGLFRPFVWESFNFLSLLASFENAILLLVVLQSLAALAQLKLSAKRLLLVATLVYVILLITFLALSTPNFGTLSRYRIAAIPMLVVVCLGPLTPLGRWLGTRFG